MTVRPAIEITLTHDAHVVRLVPTLRAATILERQEGGFPGLLQRIEELHTATIWAVVLAGATCRTTADTFLKALCDVPLITLRAVALPACLALLTACIAPNLAKATTAPRSAPERAPVAWADLYAELFGIGTGWLGWTPAETWASTIPEIVAAFDAHTAKLRAIHGGGEPDTPSGSNEDQRQANLAAGLDPDFDRAGLLALKSMT